MIGRTPPAAARRPPPWAGRLLPALAAGSIGITLNSALLALADAIHLPTGHGGLLTLLTDAILGHHHAPPGPLLKTGFHAAIGLGMAVFYARVIEPCAAGRACRKALAYAAAVWLLNAAVILPLTGEGFAGRAHLSGAGMLWFAGAHTAFFLTTAMLYARWHAGPPRGQEAVMATKAGNPSSTEATIRTSSNQGRTDRGLFR